MDSMLKDLFRKPKYVTVHADRDKRDIPEGLWRKCAQCNEIIYSKELESAAYVCAKCGYHFRLGARERIATVIDEGTFEEFGADLLTTNPLEFPGYSQKVMEAKEKTGLNEAVVTGVGSIEGQKTVIGVMDANFIMGSMGSVVGEKVTRAIEKAIEMRLPLIMFCCSGGARMQEGILSLMQMAKTSAALTKLSEAELPYISVLTDPTTGGVTASFASLGDIIIGEPGALIGFTGPRVIEQTIKKKLPEGFQTSEFMLEHGFIDIVVSRNNMKKTLADLIELHKGRD